MLCVLLLGSDYTLGFPLGEPVGFWLLFPNSLSLVVLSEKLYLSFNFLQLKQVLYLPYLLPNPWLGVRRIMGESRIATEPQEVT